MKKATGILLAFMLCWAIISQAYAMPNGYERIGISNSDTPVNVRMGPSTETQIVGKLEAGDLVTVFGINEDGWYEVSYNGQKAYVFSAYLDTSTYTNRELIGSYITYFDVGNKNRVHNICLAAEGISIKLWPDQLFKWSDVIGPASEEQGYALANIIVDDEYVQGYGGGVCQVSSTLYNAADYAGLEIIERNSHGLPVSYVPEGRDATVSYGLLDFIFRNNKPYPIQIIGFVGNGFVEVEIYKEY